MESESVPVITNGRRRMSDSLAGFLSSADAMLREDAVEGLSASSQDGLLRPFGGPDDVNPLLQNGFFATHSSTSSTSSSTKQPGGSAFSASPAGGGEPLGGINRIKGLLVQMQYQRKSFCEEAIVQYQVLEQRLCQVTQCNSVYDSSFEEVRRTLDLLMKDRQAIEAEVKHYEGKIDSVEEATNRIIGDYEQYVREEREWKDNMETQMVELKKQATCHLPDVLRDNSLNRSVTTSPLPNNAVQVPKTVDFKSPLATIAEYSSPINRASDATLADNDTDELLKRLESSYDATAGSIQHQHDQTVALEVENGNGRRKGRRLTKIFCPDCEKWKALLQSYFRSEEMSAQKISQLEKEKQTLEDVILSTRKVHLPRQSVPSANSVSNSLVIDGPIHGNEDDIANHSFGAKRQLFKDISTVSNGTHQPDISEMAASPIILAAHRNATERARSRDADEQRMIAENGDTRRMKRRSTPSPSTAASPRKKYQKLTVETNTISVPLIDAGTQYDVPSSDDEDDENSRASSRSMQYYMASTAITSAMAEKITAHVEVQTDKYQNFSPKSYHDAGNETQLPTEIELKLREMLFESEEQNAELLNIAKNSREAATKREAEITRLNADLRQRSTEIARFTTIISQLDSEQTKIVDRFTDKLGHTRQLENDLKQLRAQLSESEMQLRNMRRQFDDVNSKALRLQQQYDAERAGAADVQRLKCDADRALELARSKETYSAKAQQQLESQCKQYVSELSTLREKFQALEVENNAARACIESMTTKCSYYETLMQERNREHSRLHKQLCEQLAEQSAEGEQQLQELVRQQDDRTALQNKLAEFMEQIDAGQRQLSATRNELSLTSKLLAGQKLECYRIERDAEVFKLKLEHAEERAGQLEATLAAVRAEHEREVGSLRTQKDNLAATNQDLMRQLALEKQKGVIDKLKESIIGTPSSASGSSKQHVAAEVSRGPRGGGPSVSPHQQQKQAQGAASATLPRRVVPPPTGAKQQAVPETKSHRQAATTKLDDTINGHSRAGGVRRSASNREGSPWVSAEDTDDRTVAAVNNNNKRGAHHHSSASQYDLPNAVKSVEHESVISAVTEVGDASGSNKKFKFFSPSAAVEQPPATGTSYLKNEINDPDLSSVASFPGPAHESAAVVAESSDSVGTATPRSILKKTVTKSEISAVSSGKHCIALDSISIDSESTFDIPELDAESLSQVPAFQTRRRFAAGHVQTSSSTANTEGDSCSVSSYSTTTDGIISEFER